MSDFWVTSAGLAIAETTIGGYDGFKGYDETRVPEFVRARKTSQYARHIDHWVETLNTDNNGGYADSWFDAEVGKRMLGDTFDTCLGYSHPSSRTICAHSDVDPCFDSGLTPFTPFGSVDGKVVNSADIKALSLWALSGRADGTEFDAEEFLRQHPQWDWQRGYLKDRPQQPWTHIVPGSTGGP